MFGVFIAILGLLPGREEDISPLVPWYLSYVDLYGFAHPCFLYALHVDGVSGL